MAIPSSDSEVPGASPHRRAVRVLYFAVLREQAGLAAEEVITAADTPATLYAELAVRHGFTLAADRVRAAVNDQYVPATHPLHGGDEVLFIPPVAGG